MGGRGASTPSGAMAQVSDIGKAVVGGATTAIAKKQMIANVRLTNANATDREVDAKMNTDMFDMYNSTSAGKKAVLGGMLQQKSGVKTKYPIGAAIGAASSAKKYFEKPSRPTGPGTRVPKPTKENPWPMMDIVQKWFQVPR